MEKFGIKVIRFTNLEVENNINKVIMKIETIVKRTYLKPPSGGFGGSKSHERFMRPLWIWK